MPRIPFKIDHEFADEISGMVSLEEEYVVFEVQVVKWGISREPYETIKAEFTLVDHVRHVSGLFTDSIYIVPRRTQLLEAIPGSHKGEIRLKVPKRYREESRAFVRELTERKAHRRAS